MGRQTYEVIFRERRFASHGGLWGTTAKLDGWLDRLFGVMESNEAEGRVIWEAAAFYEAGVPQRKVLISKIIAFLDGPDVSKYD